MKSHDEVRSRIDSLEAALEALQNEGFQDEEERVLATYVVGALDWASDKATPAAKLFEALCQRFETHLKRLARKPPKRRKLLQETAAAPSGDPW